MKSTLLFLIFILLSDCLVAASVSSHCDTASWGTARSALDSSFKADPDISWNSRPKVLAETAYRKYSKKFHPLGAFGPWYLPFSPALEHKRAGFLLQLEHARSYLVKLGVKSTLPELLKEYAQVPVAYNEKASREHRATIDTLLATEPIDEYKYGMKNVGMVCLAYPSFQCQKKLKRVLQIMKPRPYLAGPFKYGSLSILDLIDKVFLDPDFRQGSSVLALKVLQHSKNGTAVGNIFEDAVSSFQEIGMGPKRSEEMALDLLGIYGTRGASMVFMEGLTNSESYPLFAALYVIFSGVTAFDESQTYSLPPDVQEGCSYGRPYHFWLGAYLAYRLRQEGFSTKSSFRAIHLVGMGYEFAGITWGKDESKIYLGKPLNFYIVATQKGILFNDAGAKFGLDLANQSHSAIDLPKVLRRMLDESQPMPSHLSQADIKEGLKSTFQKFQWFKRVIAPDVPMKVWPK